MTTIYVGNLPEDAREDTVRELFASFGRVRSVRLQRRGSQLKARSYGFVEMGATETAERAVQRLNGQYFRGNLLHVESCEEAKAAGL